MADPTINLSDVLFYGGVKSVPLILQSEVAECGLACVGMISSYYGKKLNIATLRTLFSVGTQGMSVADMIELSDNLDLTSRALQCPLEDIKHLKLPCVLHWDLDHFVVLTRVSGKSVEICDPARGKVQLSLSEIGKHFTGIALELFPSKCFKKADDRKLMKVKDLWSKITGFKTNLTILIALSLILQAFVLITPYYMQWIVDKVLLTNDDALLLVLTFGFCSLVVLKNLIQAFRSWIIVRLTTSLSIQMGANLFRHLLKLPLDYFSKRHIGDVISRFSSLEHIRELLTNNVVEVIIDGMMALVIVMVMFAYDVMLASLVVCSVALIFFIKLFFYYPYRRVQEEIIHNQAREDTVFLETVKAIQTLKLYNQDGRRTNLWLNRSAEVLNGNINHSKLTILSTTLINLTIGIEGILVYFFGAMSVMDGALTIGMLLAFVSYKTVFSDCSKNFVEKFFDFRLLSLHLERLSDITLHEVENRGGKAPCVKSGSGRIDIVNLGFRYSDKSPFVFRDLNFSIEAGESVVLTGPSGCGKSTLLKVLIGILKPTEGTVLLDGVDISEIDTTAYRSLIGSVMQNDTLLSGTIADNVTLFDPNYSRVKLDRCCQLAGLSEDIAMMPMGVFSLVGDMGNSLSGGQAQRIFLARALYFDPKILVLDEATSHLDTDKELEINRNINNLQITKVMIAHREETIRSADREIKLVSCNG